MIAIITNVTRYLNEGKDLILFDCGFKMDLKRKTHHTCLAHFI